ncbi:hypothetical protein HBN82_24440 [Pseudomonas lundensis]|uniref:hypothetical protein n=1 Tax=Pseudomonas lundensis TaxID=86185 RepID=UPI00147368C9|nr:hypothetical protein [Pseudomonas lundensis]NNA18992.1 hypothetical protein [Pseudomonas lundensis]
MDIVSGSVSYRFKGSNQVAGSIIYGYTVTAQQGFSLTMDVDLTKGAGTVTDEGKVIIDIGDAYNCRCNLVTESKAQVELGEFFKTLFMNQKPEDRVYELGMLDLGDAGALAPKSFLIRTMATEEGKILGSDTYGDGAVVLCVNTMGNPVEGDDPSDKGLDYLIPNDLDPVNGKAKYSGALVLASRVLFDWYIQYPVQKMVGNRVLFERVTESNQIARSLRAVDGALSIPSFYHKWYDSPGRREYGLSLGDHNFKLYNSEVSDKALTISVTPDAALTVKWASGLQKQKFRVHIWDFVGGDINYDSEGTVFSTVDIVFDPVIDSLDNSLTFAPRTLKSDFWSDYLPFAESYREFEFQNYVFKTFIPNVTATLDEHKRFFEDKANFESFGIPEISALAISNLLFPEKNALKLTDARLPGDLLMVGKIDPKETTITLEPLLPSIKAGGTQTFEIIQLNARAQNIVWSVSGIDSEKAVGVITDGVYTAPAAELLDGTATRNVVTASYVDDQTGQEVTASALVTVVLAGVVVTPSLSFIDSDNTGVVKRVESTKLTASTLSGSDLTWTVRDNRGSLVVNGNEAQYTPPDDAAPEGLEVVRVDIQDNVTKETVTAAVVLRSKSYMLGVYPDFHRGLRPDGKAQFVAGTGDQTLLEWEVVGGEGTITKDGVFTAPSIISTPYSIVKASLANYTSGYSIIHLSEHARASEWSTPDTFNFEVIENKSPTVYANGQQQARVVVRFKPTDVNEAPAYLSQAEFDSIRLVTADEHVALPEVGQGGVPEGGKWHFTETENTFNKYPGSSVVSVARTQVHNDSLVVKEFFVQCHKVEDLRIAAKIVNDSYGPMYSNTTDDDGELGRKVITLYAVEPPFGGSEGMTQLMFGEVPKRVSGEKDEMTLNSLDYYYLKLLIDNTQVPIHKVEFAGAVSMVKWESETSLEDVHSITGYSFGDELVRYDYNLLSKLAGQSYFPVSTVHPSHETPKGEVLITLQRREHWRHDKYTSRTFAKALSVTVYDVSGNKYSTSIGFGEDRNTLVVGTR